MERYKPKTFVGQAPVLSTESKEQFESLRADFTNSIRPQDVIERMFCGEIACLVWEIMRWRRVRDAMLNSAMQNALHDILVEDLSELEGGDETIDLPSEMAHQRRNQKPNLGDVEKIRTGPICY